MLVDDLVLVDDLLGGDAVFELFMKTSLFALDHNLIQFFKTILAFKYCFMPKVLQIPFINHFDDN